MTGQQRRIWPPLLGAIQGLAMGATSIAATAQAPAAGAARTLDEIVVTATRRSESVQDIPAAISALSHDMLRERSVHTIEQLAAVIPGLHIATYQGDSSIFIRGIGTPSIIAGTDSSTATYLDGVYISRAAAVGPAFFDVERIEVLRGPQGTLYGRNATGGAINIITRAPTDTFEVEGRAVAGNYDRYLLSGALSGPLTSRVRARLAVQAEDRDGYTTIRRPRGELPASQPDITEKVEDKSDVAARLRLQMDLSDNAVLDLTADYYRADDKANVYHFGSRGYADEIPGWYDTREGSQTIPYFMIKNAGRVTQARSRDIFADVPYFNKVEVWGLTGNLNWSIAEHTLGLVSNYKRTHPRSQNEFDLADTYNNYVGRAEDHWQWSNELQLNSPADRRFSWVAGGYFFREKNVIDNDIFGNFWEPILIEALTQLQLAGIIPPFPIDIPSSNLCCELHLSGEQETKAWAAYLDTTLELTERVSVHLGGRYSREERDGRQRFELFMLPDMRFAPNPMLFPNAISDSRDDAQPDPFGFIVAPVIGPTTFSAFTPKLGVEYSLASGLLYATAQRGFKSGGYNIGSSQREAFRPETIWSYEAGVKLAALDDRLRLNASAFRYDYRNLQAQDSIGNQPIIRNVGKARIDGLEFDAVFSPSESIALDFAVTRLNARFTEGVLTEPLRPAPLSEPPGSVLRDLDGLSLPRAPRWKLNGGAQYAWGLPGIGQLAARVDYAWQSKVYFTVFNLDAASQDSFGLLKTRLTLTPDRGNWSVALFADNLTNEKYFSNLILTGTVYGAEFVGPLGPPRIYGVEFGFRF